MVGDVERAAPAWSGKFIRLYYAGKTAKTKRFSVETSGGDSIGQIGWYSAWRKYAFLPGHHTVYEEVCLRELAVLIEALTRAHWKFKQLGYGAKVGSGQDTDDGSEIVYVGAQVVAQFPGTRPGREAARELVLLLSGGA